MDFLVFKPLFSRRLSRIFFSASSRLSRNFRGRLAGSAQIAAGGRLSRRLRGLTDTVPEFHAEAPRTGNCELRTCPRSLRGGYSESRTHDPPVESYRLNQCATTSHNFLISSLNDY